MDSFNKVVCLGKSDCGYKTLKDVIVEITLDKKGCLSIHGVVGSKSNGDAFGGCGQIYDTPIDEANIEEGWTMEKIQQFYTIWKEWHLNDMQPDCEHQRALGWKNKRINPEDLPDAKSNRDEKGLLASWIYPKEHKDGLLTKPCPVCGYKYGTAWLKKELPYEVINFLKLLPPTKKHYYWV